MVNKISSENDNASLQSKLKLGLWQYIDDILGRFRTIVFSFSVIAAAILLAVATWKELVRNPFIIEPPLVPPHVAQLGLSGDAIARIIRDHIREINENAETLRDRHEYGFEHDQINVVLPGSNFSIRGLVSLIRYVFGWPVHRFTGEIVQYDGLKIPNGCPEKNDDVPKYVLTGRISDASSSVIVCANTIWELLRPTAELILENDSPYILAAYLSDKDYVRANAIAEKILQGKNLLSDRQWALILQSYMLAEKREYWSAINKCKDAIEIEPNFFIPYNNWAGLLNALDRPDEAIEKLKQAVNIAEDADIYANWGVALRILDKPAEAIKMYQKSLELDKYYVKAYDGWGDVLRDLAEPKQAIEKYQQAIRFDPEYASAYSGWGDALRDMNESSNAIEKYKEALVRDPDYIDAYCGWGDALRSLNQPAEAIEQYKKAIEVFPNYVKAYYGWEQALRDQKKLEEADLMFAQAEKIKNTSGLYKKSLEPKSSDWMPGRRKSGRRK